MKSTGADLEGARRRIDEALGRFGIVPAPGPARALQWQGVHDGRSWEAWLGQRRQYAYFGDQRTRRTIGYKLRLAATTPVMMRAYFLKEGFATNVLARALHRRGGLELLPAASQGFEGFRVVACDGAWMTRLLARPEAAALIGQLLEYRPGLGECAEIYFEPGRLHYASTQLQPADVDTGVVAQTLSRLAALAHEAEAAPAPATPATASAAASQGIGRLLMAVGAAFVGCLAVLAIGALLVGALAWVTLR